LPWYSKRSINFFFHLVIRRRTVVAN
jgi:hypothetical protein